MEEAWQQESQKAVSWQSGSSHQEKSKAGIRAPASWENLGPGSKRKLRQRCLQWAVGQRTQLHGQVRYSFDTAGLVQTLGADRPERLALRLALVRMGWASTCSTRSPAQACS